MRLWFRAKRYGWGWTPATIEGWLVMAAFVAAIIVDAVGLIHRTRTGVDVRSAMVTFYVWIGILLVALAGVCWMTGERPRWRWGKEQ
jgi:hypothetical protein